MKKITSHNFFNLFLFVYLAVLAYHGIHEISLWLFLGIFVAVFAHSKNNVLTLLLLFGHMAVEWFEWGSTLSQITLMALLLNIFHTIMDFTFLYHEVKAHLKKNMFLILGSVSVFLLFIFFIASSVSIDEEALEILHPFVLGGVIGCVASHLYFHLKRE